LVFIQLFVKIPQPEVGEVTFSIFNIQQAAICY